MFESHSEAIYELLRVGDRVDSARLAELREVSRACGASLADVVIERGFMAKPALLAKIADYVGCDYLPEPPSGLAGEVVGLLPGSLARSYGVMPWRDTGRRIEFLVADPFNRELVGELTFALDREVGLTVCDPACVENLIQRHYRENETPVDDAKPRMDLPASASTEEEPTAKDLEAMAAQAPIVRFVNQMLAQAIRDQASDIHFEPFEHEFKIRYRIDGALYELPSPPKAMALPVTSRIKVLADLNIAERRFPQDGRIRLPFGARSVDLRVATMPTQFGESVVLRVLDRAAVQLDLTELGMPPEVQRGMQQVIRRPHGLVLVTGPTGSGKTTTLYSALRAINTAELKLLTIEDPVEYAMDGVMQVPVNPAAGLTFASALRAFLRQDPDVIMIGEMRDVETAQIAIQAALTGHLVLSTLHTNDALAAVTRLLDMGVEPFLLASTVEAVLAQRLVRRICPHCRTTDDPSAALRAQFGLISTSDWNGEFFRGRGCDHCGHTGYRGRMGIFEWLLFAEPLRELVARKAPAQLIRQKAAEEGMRPLREDGVRAARNGVTTLEELAKYI